MKNPPNPYRRSTNGQSRVMLAGRRRRTTVLLFFLLVSTAPGLISPVACGQKFKKHAGVVYHQGANFELKCDVYCPNQTGKFPAVIAIHGGSWRVGSKVQMNRHARLMAKHGYAVMAINYRHQPQHPFPAQILDAKRAVAWLRAHQKKYRVDGTRIGAFGYSAGAQIAAMLGCSDADDGFEEFEKSDLPPTVDTRISAVVIGGAPCEFSWIKPRSTVLAGWLGGSRRQVPERYHAASPINYITPDDPPFYLFHGELDLIVPVKSSRAMCRRLLDTGVAAKLDVVANCEHFWPFSDLEYMRRGIQFFDRHLKSDSDRKKFPLVKINPKLKSVESYKMTLLRLLGRSLLKTAFRIRYDLHSL